MRSRCPWLPVLLLLTAHGQAAASPVGLADVLFDQGVADMKAGRFEAACPALQESYRLEPQLGALFALASCEEKWGKTWSAVSHYREYLELFARLDDVGQRAQHGRDTFAAAQVAALGPQVPAVTLKLAGPAPAGVEIRLDGTALDPRWLNAEFPINPGEHAVRLRAPGGTSLEQRFTIGPGERRTVPIRLPAAPARAAPPPALSPVRGAQDADHGPRAGGPGGSGLRVAGYVAGGLGLAGVAAGAVTGGLVFSKKAVVEHNCNGLDCNHDGKQAADSARPLALASTISFAAGAAALAAGAVLLLAAPGPSRDGSAAAQRLGVAVTTRPGEHVVSLQGAW